MNCRYNGHVNKFYSVAEHSIIVSELSEDKKWGLMHDVTEAFVPDIPRPFKAFIGGFDEFEERIARAIAKHYNLSWPMPDEVAYIDKNIIHDEVKVLFKETPDWFDFYDSVNAEPLIIGMEPKQAEALFLYKFKGLFGK